jgi:hypothetical protein
MVLRASCSSIKARARYFFSDTPVWPTSTIGGLTKHLKTYTPFKQSDSHSDFRCKGDLPPVQVNLPLFAPPPNAEIRQCERRLAVRLRQKPCRTRAPLKSTFQDARYGVFAMSGIVPRPFKTQADHHEYLALKRLLNNNITCFVTR